MQTSVTITKISAALIEAQKAIGAAKKGSENPFFKSSYADLGSVMQACKEALNDNGITVLQPVGTDEMGNVYVETVLLHSSGEFIADKMKIVVKVTNDPQAQGSAITYARRYSLQSMVFIPAEDDDANQAAGQKKITTAPKPQVQTSTGRVVYITPKQKGMIQGQLTRIGHNEQWLTEQLKKKYNLDDYHKLSVMQASEVIDGLMKMPDKVQDEDPSVESTDEQIADDVEKGMSLTEPK